MIHNRKNVKQLLLILWGTMMVFTVFGCSAEKQSSPTPTPSYATDSDGVSPVDTIFEETTSEIMGEESENVEESTALIIDDNKRGQEELEPLETPDTPTEEITNNTFLVTDHNEDKVDGAVTNDAIENSEIAVEDILNQTSSNVESTVVNEKETDLDFEENEQGLTDTQRKSVNMLNYMTLLTEQINENRGNQIFLDSAYLSLKNDIFPEVDTKTQGQITRLMDKINKYRMIIAKRERLNLIYEQNQAQALRKAISNPIGLLSLVQSGNVLKAAASVLYMAVDSISSYTSAKSQIDLQFIKDGWELDSTESDEIHESTTAALNYMFNMVRDYDLPGDYALSAEAVESFVTWSNKPDSQLINKIRWLESHEGTYRIYGPYWLEKAKNYYNSGRYQDCLDSINQYEAVSSRIFRADLDYANVLPMAIISAKEIMDEKEYVDFAGKYCDLILANSKDDNWSLRFFVAQIYLDFYQSTNNQTYLDNAYQIIFDNVNELVDVQRKLNDNYLAAVQEVKVAKNATKRQKDETNKYNKLIKEERKIALPPVNEAFYLNCDLLFALAEERHISDTEKRIIEATLHENGDNIFLTQALDDRFWFEKKESLINIDELEVSFDGNKMTIPASCVTDRSKITVTVKGVEGITTLDDWVVTNVKRPKNTDCSGFIVYYESKLGDKYKYKAGDSIVIKITPVSETPEKYYEFLYVVKPVKVAFIISGVKYERVIE